MAGLTWTISSSPSRQLKRLLAHAAPCQQVHLWEAPAAAPGHGVEKLCHPKARGWHEVESVGKP